MKFSMGLINIRPDNPHGCKTCVIPIAGEIVGGSMDEGRVAVEYSNPPSWMIVREKMRGQFFGSQAVRRLSLFESGGRWIGVEDMQPYAVEWVTSSR